MSSSDDAPSEARATATRATKRRLYIHRAFVVAGIGYMIWLLDNARTDSPIPIPQINTAITVSLTAGAVLSRPRSVPAETLQLASEVRAMSARLDEMEQTLVVLDEHLEGALTASLRRGLVMGAEGAATKLRLVAPNT